jgi:hypothetical protein
MLYQKNLATLSWNEFYYWPKIFRLAFCTKRSLIAKRLLQQQQKIDTCPDEMFSETGCELERSWWTAP